MFGLKRKLTITCNVCVRMALLVHSVRHRKKIVGVILVTMVECAYKHNSPTPKVLPLKNITATVRLPPMEIACTRANFANTNPNAFALTTIPTFGAPTVAAAIPTPPRDATAHLDTRDSNASTVTKRILTIRMTVVPPTRNSVVMFGVSMEANVSLPHSLFPTELPRLNKAVTVLIPLMEFTIGEVHRANTSPPVLVMLTACSVPIWGNVPQRRMTSLASVLMDGKEITARFTFTHSKMNTPMTPNVVKRCASTEELVSRQKSSKAPMKRSVNSIATVPLP